MKGTSTEPHDAKRRQQTRSTTVATSTAGLVLAGVSAGYDDVPVLHDVSLRVPSSRVVAVLGANGAGKSTLLRTISGILRPTVGGISFGSTRLNGLAPHKIARTGIVHVPEGRGIFPGLTVEETLALGLHGRPRRNPGTGAAASLTFSQWCDRVYEIFPRLGERRRQQTQTMSGGEQQMLAIARGLLAEPRLMMLDEPSLGLSPRFVDEVFERLHFLAEGGQALLIVEQNAAVALDIADYGYVLVRGTVRFSGTGQELKSNDDLRRAYLAGI